MIHTCSRYTNTFGRFTRMLPPSRSGIQGVPCWNTISDAQCSLRHLLGVGRNSPPQRRFSGRTHAKRTIRRHGPGEDKRGGWSVDGDGVVTGWRLWKTGQSILSYSTRTAETAIWKAVVKVTLNDELKQHC